MFPGHVASEMRRLMTWTDGMAHNGGLRLEAATGFAPFEENVPLSMSTCEAGKGIALWYVLDRVHHT